MKVKIKLLGDNPEAHQPALGTPGSVGWDVFASIGCAPLDHIDFKAGDVKKVPLGFAMEMPDTLYADIRNRSGHTLAGDFIVELGTIDSDYRQEVCAIVRAYKDFRMFNGAKIAQMMFHKRVPVSMCAVEELSDTLRSGGFGSTGL